MPPGSIYTIFKISSSFILYLLQPYSYENINVSVFIIWEYTIYIILKGIICSFSSFSHYIKVFVVYLICLSAWNQSMKIFLSWSKYLSPLHTSSSAGVCDPYLDILQHPRVWAWPMVSRCVSSTCLPSTPKLLCQEKLNIYSLKPRC